MSQIAIISQPDQGVLLDVSGCQSLREALEHLSSTLQVSSQFWHGLEVSINLGALSLAPDEVQKVMAIAKGVGITPTGVYTTDSFTKGSLEATKIPLGSGKPMTLPEVNIDPAMIHDAIPVDLPITTIESNVVSDTIIRNERSIRKTIANRRISITQGDGSQIVVTVDPEMAIKTDNCTKSEVMLEEKIQAVEEEEETKAPLPQTLYIRQTLRSGQCVSHQGHLVIIGDINPGAEVMAEGDITVWGSLRGIAHAGISGNTNAEIRAINLQPIQIRIADAIARSPDRKGVKYTSSAAPEMAKLVDGKVKVYKYKFN